MRGLKERTMLAPADTWMARWRSPTLGLLTVVIMAGSFVLDLMTPQGVAAWVLYPVAVVAAMGWRGRGAVIATILAASGLTIAGFWLSPAGHAGIDFTNRIVAVAMVCLAGMGCLWVLKIEGEHEQAQTSQQHSEITLRSVVQSATDAIILADGSGNVVSWNKAATTIFGHKEKDVMGKPLTMLMPERYRGAHQQGLERVRVTGESHLVGQTVELQGLRNDGSEFPLELSLASWKTKGDVYFSGIIRDISLRKREKNHLAVQYAMVRALAESSTLSEMASSMLQTVCEMVGWEVGSLWVVDNDTRVLRCTDLWHMPLLDVVEFEAATKAARFASGVGLPGRVWSSGNPAWITDVAQDGNFPRVSIARKTGLHGAFAFPILIGSEVVGVIEFFSRWVRKPDTDLLLMMGALGNQIGLFLSRKRVEAERERLVSELQEALANIKTLRGLLPICAACKKVRDDSGYWNRIEDYVRDRSHAEFTHGICPECAKKIHPDWDDH